jgi:NOL1/NOP2/fmu family ribosome biogenesis protein
MFIGYAIDQWIPPDQPILALDLAAAPGGKSTLLLEKLHPDSLLVANEVIRNRYPILRYNHQKWGYANVLCANHDPEDFVPLAGQFDLVLVDAPCSGEGLFRKDPAARSEWSLKAVEHCALRQQRILQAAAPLVKPGGYLFYSTCTYNERENRESLATVSHSAEWEPMRLPLPPAWGILEQEWGYQFFPHRLRGEGFFFAALRKKEGKSEIGTRVKLKTPWPLLPQKSIDPISNWVKDPAGTAFFDSGSTITALPKRHLEISALITQKLTRVKPVLEIGQIKKNGLVPSPALALSLDLGSLPGMEVGKDEALRYLKGETLPARRDKKGWQLICFEGKPLGWGKAIPQRINNYYPKEWRIRMRIKG